MKKEIEMYWKYLGEGHYFVPSVPMRDLTVEEVNARQIADLVENSPLYELRPVKAKTDHKE